MTREDDLMAVVSAQGIRIRQLEKLNTQLRDALAKSIGTYREFADEVDAILDSSPLPFAAARQSKAMRKARHRARARELLEGGLSWPQIGIRMALDDGRPDRPYSERTVARWLEPSAEEDDAST